MDTIIEVRGGGALPPEGPAQPGAKDETARGGGRDPRLGPFLLGLFLCLPGVAITWLAAREEGGWTGRVQAAAWLGCVLSPVWWTLVVVVCVLLVVAGVVPLSHLLTGRW